MPTEAEPVTILEGDCLSVMARLPAGSVDAVVTDPPYGLEFMGKGWDGVVPGIPFWSAALRVLKPGGYACIFGGTRTYHRLACAVEDAGFEIRDCISWLYGSGFPKGKGCLKPAYEPILLCRKPGPKVLPLGIDDCRVGTEEITTHSRGKNEAFPKRVGETTVAESGRSIPQNNIDPCPRSGRWPANIVHDGSEEVLEAFAAFGEKTSGSGKRRPHEWQSRNAYGFSESVNGASDYERDGDSGTAARFFYTAKASRKERGEGNNHPTVKPLALMRWLVRLVARPGDLVLDPFGGSGTTGKAALEESRRCIIIEKEPAYVEIARRRVAEAMGTGLLAGVGA